MNRISVSCMIGALIIGSIHFPQYAIGETTAIWSWAFSIPIICLMIYGNVMKKHWLPILMGMVGGWFVASVMIEQWLAPFPQIHWLRSFGIDTTPIALHLFAIFALMGITHIKNGVLKRTLGVLACLGILTYWVIPQQFLFENIRSLTQNTGETVIFQDGSLTSVHWRREVYSDPPWKEFPSVAYNEYELAAIGHGMGLQMDPDNEWRRKFLYFIQVNGSIGVIYLRVVASLLSIAFVISAILSRLQKRTASLYRSCITICYVIPPVLNLLLSAAALGFAEAEGEIARYVWINLSLTLASVGVLQLNRSYKEAL